MILHACTAGETRLASDFSWLSNSYTIIVKSAADSLLYTPKRNRKFLATLQMCTKAIRVRYAKCATESLHHHKEKKVFWHKFITI